MAIRDRGKVKWQMAFGMPEHVKMLGELRTDYYRQAKPQLDGYQYDEIDECLTEALADNKPVKVTTWANGFTTDICGRIDSVDPITKQLRIDGQRVRFADIIGVVIADD
jgi:hypothetical protein